MSNSKVSGVGRGRRFRDHASARARGRHADALYPGPGGRGIRRLVSARLYRHEQPAVQRARPRPVRDRARLRLARHRRLLECAVLRRSASATSTIAGSASTSPPSIAAAPTSRRSITYTDVGWPFNTNDYTGIKKEWLFLANAFVDLGTWRSITPYVGVGVGFANVTISNFRDTNVIAGGGGWADTGSPVELRLGALCRPRLQGHADLLGRSRLPLRQPRRWQDRRLS